MTPFFLNFEVEICRAEEIGDNERTIRLNSRSLPPPYRLPLEIFTIIADLKFEDYRKKFSINTSNSDRALGGGDADQILSG